MILSSEDLQHQFDAATLAEGSACLNQGSVSVPEVRRDGELITATVQNTTPTPYRVYVRVAPGGGGRPAIRGECSCPQRGGCSHVAAALLSALRAEQAPVERCPAPAVLTDGYPADVHQRLLYILYPQRAGTLEVATLSARLRPDGGFERQASYRPEWAARGLPPRFLLAVDRRLLAELGRCQPVAGGERHLLLGTSAPELLQRLLDTGRCFLAEGSSPLRLADPRTARPRWQMDCSGWQILDWHPCPGRVCLLPAAWYLDRATAQCGPLQTALVPELLEHLARLGPVEPETAATVLAELTHRFPGAGLPLLQVLVQENLPAVPPRPALHLLSLPGPDGQWQDRARLSFEYHGLPLAEGQRPRLVRGGRLLRLVRDVACERACRRRLAALGLQRDAGGEWAPEGDGPAWIELQASGLPELEQSGWRVSIDPAFRHRLHETGPWRCTVDESADGESLDLDMSTEVEGRRVNLLPTLQALLRRLPREPNREGLHRLAGLLEDGRPLAVPAERLRQVADSLVELYRAESLADGPLRLDRARAPRLLELEGRVELHWPGADAWRRRLEALVTGADVSEVLPLGLQVTLRDYQRQGLAWLQRLRQYGLAGVLADDMGLGKTIQTLAHLLLEREQSRADRPSLVVVPTSLLDTWREAARRFAPGLRVLVLHGPGRHVQHASVAEHDLVLTTYPLLARDQQALAGQPWHLLVLDEAQLIKNPASQAGGVVRGLQARYRLCLTGTPLENHLGELWSLFDFLLPGLLGSAERFRRQFRIPIEELGDEQAQARLARRVRPFLLRRTKSAVAPELPPKTEMVRGVELQGAQRALYEEIRLTMREQVRQAVAERGWAHSGMLVLEALLKLRQVCCDPRLLGSEGSRVEASAKLGLLTELLPEMIEEGRRVLLYSQFTSMLALIRTEVEAAGIPYVELTGRSRDRATPVARFQAGEVPLFLISLRAGGTGLNLTAADTVIHYDPWWNPAVERQASDRAHRIGQDQPVFIYKLICTGTVEARIQEIQQRKQALADGLLQRTGIRALHWDVEELARLLEPLE